MKILVVEDETMVARNLCRLLQELLGSSLLSLQHVYSLGEAEGYLESHTIDLLFLDLNLSGEDGFDLLSGVVARAFQTIVVSANTDQALRSYEYGVLDFIPKPCKIERLKQAMDKLQLPDSDAMVGTGQAKYLGIKNIGHMRLIAVCDIWSIKADGRYSEIFMRDGLVHLHEKQLKHLLSILPEHFQRVHKSYVVNLNYVEKILSYSGSKYELSIHEGEHIPVGRKYISSLRKRLS